MLESRFEPVNLGSTGTNIVDTDLPPIASSPCGKADEKRVEEKTITGDENRAKILAALHQCSMQQQAIKLIGQYVAAHNLLDACWFYEQEEESKARAASLLDKEADALLETEPNIPELFRATVGKNRTCQTVCQTLNQQIAIAVPICPDNSGSDRTGELFCGLVSSDGNVVAARKNLETAADYLLFWRTVSQFRQSQVFSRFASQAIAIMQKMSEKENSSAANMVLVNGLQDMLGCQRVISVFTNPTTDSHTLKAISGTDSFDAKSPLATKIREVSQSTSDAGQSINWCRDGEQTAETEVFAELGEKISADYIVTIPTLNAQTQNGCLIIAGDEKLAASTEMLCATKMLGELVGSQFAHLKNNEARIGKLAGKVKKFSRSRIGSICLFATLAIFVIMLIPIQYRIPCDCVVQPVSRHFVAAPFDGKLDETFVEVGDVVKKGDLLARLDGVEIRMELSALQASFQRESKRHDAALAARDIAESQIARHEMEKIKLDVELLEKRTANLDIISPADGVVVAGDLKKVEGSPLKIGQSMFEIAPLEKMVVEVLVPEEQSSYVEKEMEVALRTDALPFEKFAGTIKRLHPRSEMRDDESVFVAEFELDNEQGNLRPGMNGSAKVTSGRRSIGWILFHRAWEKTMFQFGI